MKLALAAVGRLRGSGLAELAEDYGRRIRRALPFEMIEVREARGLPESAAREEESGALRAALARGLEVVALDETGELLASVELARKLERAMTGGSPGWGLMVGGAAGLTPDLVRTARWCWSLSPLTLPHELARIVAIEQLYRATTILRGEPYHRAADAGGREAGPPRRRR